ncbi:MAG: DUF2007 domain-containing protein [Oleiphilaceae bacterium]|nr:DUF2007 domain-containing protein [Oleiphilaceae bacterium]
MSWVTVGQYTLPFEAHLGKSRLESEGITAIVADEHTISMQWMLSDALGGVRLRVQEEDLSRAEAVLAEDRSDLVEESRSEPVADQWREEPGLRLSPLAGEKRKRGFFAALLAFFIGS